MATEAAWAGSGRLRNPEYARSQYSSDSRISPSHHSASARPDRISALSSCSSSAPEECFAASLAPLARRPVLGLAGQPQWSPRTEVGKVGLYPWIRPLPLSPRCEGKADQKPSL